MNKPIPLLAICALLAGCNSVSYSQKKTVIDPKTGITTTTESKGSASNFFEGGNSLGKFDATQGKGDDLQKATVGSLGQVTSATNTGSALAEIAAAITKAAIEAKTGGLVTPKP